MSAAALFIPTTATHSDAKPATRPATSQGWKTRIPATLDVSKITPPHFMMLFILESLCRSVSYCWPSNALLATMYGCSIRNVKEILREMQEEGYLWRLPVERGSGRAGIFLHRRLDPDLPVEDRPPPPEAVQRLWAARNRSRSAPSPRPENCPPTRAEKFPRPGAEKFPPSK